MDIDIVFSGGGVKGFALLGAYEAIEEKGLRWKRLAGTSAGSLLSALLSAGYKAHEIASLLEDLELTQFLDERPLWVPFPFWKWVRLYWHLGLYQGKVFEQWVEAVLAARGVRTFQDVPAGSLYIVASDVTNGRIVVLPDDLAIYGIDPGAFSIARAVRMSISIPYFFEPIRLRGRNGVSLIVDGGVLSNFPLFLFDEEKKKKRPVLGVQLSPKPGERPKRTITNALDLYEALFAAMKEAHDARYISRRHEKNIVFLPVDNVISTEFSIDPEVRRRLIDYGRERTRQFLRQWAY
ncbi:patatin-like phospholipase family protein [Geobacillus kaustophilus]|uniref:Patatin-like phospholipase family protein n=1 Tax=Geobacillus kaustophilus TaxID=1462 RepID=A0A0D8BVF0_GEOKU|nr:patatin-like phospholipase family protein [Geobacillus kaustophilus]KJE27969.1 patatin-like phospholipase family protein [Geobacillus kaustophilus]